MRIMRSGANYFNDPKKVRSQRAGKTTLVSSLLASLLIAVIFVSSLGLSSSVAFADDEDQFDSSAIEGAFDGANPDELSDYLEEYSDGLVENNTFQYVLGRLLIPDYINYLPHAVVGSNAQTQANSIGFAPNGGNDAANYICKTNQTGAGTPVYHNCDVPNFSAEFVQNLYSLFDRSGAQNAFALNASSILFPTFGQPKALPGGAVPADTTGAGNKYTGLEVFGYDLQLSSYFGEWDHIQTLNQARLLTNFSFFDSVNLTAQSIGNAIGGAFNRAGSMSAQGWNSGGIFGAIGGFFGGLFEGGASGAMNTLLDTSEANTVLTFGWYRANYSNTSYGLRELSNQEIVAQIRQGFLEYMNSTMPEDMTYDEWLQVTDPSGSLMSTPPAPPIANCTVYTTPGGGEVVHGTAADAPPGITADSCDQLKRDADKAYFDGLYQGNWSSGMSLSSGSIVYTGGNYYQAKRSVSSSTTNPSSDSANFTNVSGKIVGSGPARGFDLGAPDKGDGRGGWDKDGAKKAESFNEWYAKVKSTAGNWDASLGEYGISLDAGSCSPANADVQEEAAAKSAYTSWLSGCWTPEWGPAAEANEIENQSEMNTVWLTSLLTPSVLAKWGATPAGQGVFDFNSPWARYVCLNADGSDVTNGIWENNASSKGDHGTPILVSAFDASGNTNALCPQSEYRPPIQGGLLGDGYAASGANQDPGVDTRHISNFMGPMIAAAYPFFFQPMNSVTQFAFTVGQFATQVSNEIITWTYMPILESLGITTMVANLIDSLRDSIFFPLAVLVIAGAALYILYQAGIKRRYREMFVSTLYVALLFILGAALMTRPTDVINIVDRAPANVEKAVMSLILSPSISEDRICATGTSATSAGGTANWDDLDLTAGSEAGGFNDMFSGSYNVSDDALREVLCTNWKAFVYYPWVFAQWGTSPDNLDASDMQNTNQSLIGEGTVDLGGANGEINNWAVYQLKSMKIGSSTTIDWNVTGVQVKSKDFYRLVDLQAGPNGGAGTDPRYIQAWSGMDPMSRMGTGILSGVVAVIGAVTVTAYSVTKILITFTSVFLLIFLPIVFLFGLFPTKRKFVRDYLMTILSLMIQRVALMLMIALFLLMLMGIISSANNYMSIFLGALLICLAFLKFRKPIVDFAMSAGGAGSSAFGRMASNANGWATGMLGVDGGKAMGQTWKKTADSTSAFTPTTVRNMNDRLVAGVRNGVAGGLAGAATGRGFIQGADSWAGSKDLLIARKQRRTGWGALEAVAKTREQLEAQVRSDAEADGGVKNHLSELQAELPNVKEYFKDFEEYQKNTQEFYAAVDDGRIKEEPALDEYGDQLRDSSGNTVFRYQRVDSKFNPQTGERVVVFSEIEPPQEPEKPQFVDRELTVKEIGDVRRFGELSDRRKALVAAKDENLKSLYNTSKRSFTLDLPPNSSPAEISKFLEEVMPDSEGFTNVSRKSAMDIVQKMTLQDREINAVDAQMDTLSKKFAENYQEAAYKANPMATQAAVVDAVQDSMNNPRGGA